MSRVLAVPQHVQDVGLAAVAELLHVLLLTGKRQDVVGGTQHKGGLEISHDLLPDCSLHGEMSLDMFDVLFSQCFTASPLLQCLVDHLLAAPLLLVLLPLLLLELVITGAHGHGTVGLRLLKTQNIASRNLSDMSLFNKSKSNPSLRLGLNIFKIFQPI